MAGPRTPTTAPLSVNLPRFRCPAGAQGQKRKTFKGTRAPLHVRLWYRIEIGSRRMAKGNFGERLKREREMREVSLAEVTSGTRIGQRFLEALENEEWDKLPGGIFSRGFVRSIARYLGLNEEDFLAK